ncbi:hypothetical protein C8034_v004411 [Colletotrichum sidae]|uniref:Uncharacterized protein n=1 Tax=Colletotrichum sidae TaxID=1347389 RepID=A0A4R8T7S7_9PEZI|nr:hypothetical protein C8034_v004411 [Colletotrichum sidae]
MSRFVTHFLLLLSGIIVHTTASTTHNVPGASQKLKRQVMLPPGKPRDRPQQLFPFTITEAEAVNAEPPRQPAELQEWYGTSMYGFVGCANVEYIKLAYSEAQNILHSEGINSNIDWTSSAAVEYLGPPYENLDQRAYIQKKLANMTMAWAPGPYAKWVQVRCDDPAQRCAVTCPITTEDQVTRMPTYSVNPSPDAPLGQSWPYINLCEEFWNAKPNLRDIVESSRQETDWRKKYHIESYRSRASLILRELIQLEFNAIENRNTMPLGAEQGPGALVKSGKMAANDELPQPQARSDGPLVDLAMKLNYAQERTKEGRLSGWLSAHGTIFTKILARFQPKGYDIDIGHYTRRNINSVTGFVLATYITEETGIYPFLPMVYPAAWWEDVPFHFVIRDIPGAAWWTDSQNGVVLNMSKAVQMSPLPDLSGKCRESSANWQDDYEVGEPHSEFLYPTAYNFAIRDWYKLIRDGNPNPGSCRLNMTQIQTCDPQGSNQFVRLSLTSPTGDLLYASPDTDPYRGEALNLYQSIEVKQGQMAETLRITLKEHEAIWMQYGESEWATNLVVGASKCVVTRDKWKAYGPVDCPAPPLDVYREYDCVFKC